MLTLALCEHTEECSQGLVMYQSINMQHRDL